MNTVFKYLPEVDGSELHYLGELFKDFDDEKARNFANIYRSRRRDPNMILLTTLAGFMGIAGIQRFLTDQIGLEFFISSLPVFALSEPLLTW